MSTVTLSCAEVMQAALVGIMRQITNIKDGTVERPRYGAGQHQSWTLHIEGACGEMAVAKALDVCWTGNIWRRKAKDVGGYQVRTASFEQGELKLHPKDKDEDVFILARGFAPTYELVGWIVAVDGKRQEYWKALQKGRPCYVVPDDALRPMADLGALRAAA